MTKYGLLAASAIALIAANPALAQEVAETPAPAPAPAPGPTSTQPNYGNDIVVTAQRQSQSLQAVPIAVSAFSAEALQEQQIDNATDLQLTLPNVQFSKGNFTAASFTIRGIGDLCVGISCDSATAIHTNGSPLIGTRLFEAEYFDLERIEVLRGPQGTLFGRSATSGVVNVITAKPELDAFHASGDLEYGNYESIRARAMINLPIGETLGVRVAGFYLNRDGYTKNVFNDTRIDGRDIYAVRGSIRWQPTVDTTVDLMGYYFHEDDDRLRIQKQQCQRDPTGTLGCLNGRRDFARTNTNSTFTGTLGSSEFLALNLGAIGGPLGLNSLYGPDGYAGFTDPRDVRSVATAFTPEYFSDELQIQGRIDHNFGPIGVQLTGLYQESSVDSRQDYNLGISSRAATVTGLSTLSALAAGAVPGVPASYFTPLVNAIIPNGPGGQLCTSNTNPNGLGGFGGDNICSDVPLAFDRSRSDTRTYSGEAIISSDFDGAFNFLLGGIYLDSKTVDGDYFVNAFAIDYVTGVLGSFTSLGAGAPASFLGTPYFINATPEFRLKSYGIFGEGYLQFNDELKLTVGLRYNNDRKAVRARSTLASFLVPYGQTGTAFDSPFVGTYDADPVVPGVQNFAIRNATFDKVTGRAVLDYQFTPNNLLYASYSRGYKSGGFNPPVQVPGLTIPDTFQPEQIDSFEIGSKNTFANGALTLNATAFYYKYKGLQLSRIVARSSINDNIDADIYGVEAEAVFRPDRLTTINLGFSYLKTEVKEDSLFINQRDPSGGNPNAVIIKDIGAAFNCAVTGSSSAAAQAFVTGVNSALGLRGPQAYPSDANLGAAAGAFSLCSVIAAQSATPAAQSLGITYYGDGIPVSIRGNELPQAPVAKFNVGVQRVFEIGDSGFNIVPRGDLTYTGDSYGNIFNGRVNKIEGFEIVNAQVQLNAPDDRFFVRGFIQNIFDNNAVTGLYLTDQSSGLFTNIFTLEPRRYGIGAGFKF